MYSGRPQVFGNPASFAEKLSVSDFVLSFCDNRIFVSMFFDNTGKDFEKGPGGGIRSHCERLASIALKV
jgi:hypothetical protein